MYMSVSSLAWQGPHGHCPTHAYYTLSGSKTLKIHLFTIYPVFLDHTL